MEIKKQTKTLWGTCFSLGSPKSKPWDKLEAFTCKVNPGITNEDMGKGRQWMEKNKKRFMNEWVSILDNFSSIPLRIFWETLWLCLKITPPVGTCHLFEAEVAPRGINFWVSGFCTCLWKPSGKEEESPQGGTMSAVSWIQVGRGPGKARHGSC